MSHVDDATLHAYLDGELASVELERLETHLAGCAPCRARLAEERALIERANRLLGLVTPPERSAPPWHELRRGSPRLLRRFRVPLVWAATVVLAVGIGWYARGLETRAGMTSASRSDALLPVSRTETGSTATAMPAPSPAASGRLERQRPKREAAAGELVVDGGLVRDGGGIEADEQLPATAPTAQAGKAADRLANESARIVLRAETPPPAAMQENVVVAAPSQAVSARDDAGRPRLPTSWPVIERGPARELLGADPVIIPGVPISTLRRHPAGRSEVVVEQEVATGVLIQLFESRAAQGYRLTDSPAAGGGGRGELERRRANERLARFVGPLRVEIAGPLPPDSLSKLLELVR